MEFKTIELLIIIAVVLLAAYGVGRRLLRTAGRAADPSRRICCDSCSCCVDKQPDCSPENGSTTTDREADRGR